MNREGRIMKQLTDHAHELTQKWGREDRERERDAHDKSRLKHHGSNWAQAYRVFESLISASFQCGFLLGSLLFLIAKPLQKVI